MASVQNLDEHVQGTGVQGTTYKVQGGGVQGGGSTPPPPVTSRILTQSGNFLSTEAGNHLVTE